MVYLDPADQYLDMRREGSAWEWLHWLGVREKNGHHPRSHSSVCPSLGQNSLTALASGRGCQGQLGPVDLSWGWLA